MRYILVLALALTTASSIQPTCISCPVHKHIHPESQCGHCHKSHKRKKPRNPFKMYETREDAGPDDYADQDIK